MAEAEQRPVKGFIIATNLVAFIFGMALTVIVLFAGVVTPPI